MKRRTPPLLRVMERIPERQSEFIAYGVAPPVYSAATALGSLSSVALSSEHLGGLRTHKFRSISNLERNGRWTGRVLTGGFESTYQSWPIPKAHLRRTS